MPCVPHGIQAVAEGVAEAAVLAAGSVVSEVWVVVMIVAAGLWWFVAHIASCVFGALTPSFLLLVWLRRGWG